MTTQDDLVSGKKTSKLKHISPLHQFLPLMTSVISPLLTHSSTKHTLQQALHSHQLNQLQPLSLSTRVHTNSLTVSKTMLVMSPSDTIQVFLLPASHQPISQQFLVLLQRLFQISQPTSLLSSREYLQRLVSDNSDMV